MTRRLAAATLFCALLVAVPGHSEHSRDWVEPAVTLEVESDRRTERILAALERVPDCLQERMNLLGAQVIVIGLAPPADHPMQPRLGRDFYTRGWRLLAAPFVRVQGRAYPLAQTAFVRRGARGVGRSALFTRSVPLTGRGERTALHEYGHLVAHALAIADETEFFTLWARHSPRAVVDALSPRSEPVQQQEWFARVFAAFYESDEESERLAGDVRDYLTRLESAVHRGDHDARVLELARLTSRNPRLSAARAVGERLLPAGLAGELRSRGAWGLGYFGQLWYSIQSSSSRARHGSAFELLDQRRARLVDAGVVERREEVHLRETCGDLGSTPLCRAVHEHRSRIELWHPCLGPPLDGCLISFGPTAALLEREPDGEGYPWVAAERHREIALGRGQGSRVRLPPGAAGRSAGPGNARPPDPAAPGG